MASGRIIVPGYMPALDGNGDPVSGAKLYIYENLTTTLAQVYSDRALTAPILNPVSANISGQFPTIFADATVLYSVMVVDQTGATFGDPSAFDNLRPSSSQSSQIVLLEDYGALGNDPASDTAALLAAMAVPGNEVWGTPGQVYYIKAGASCAAGTVLKRAILKLKMGPGGFASKDTGTSRYDPSQCLLNWSGVDGGGYEDLQVYGDLSPAAGGEYAVLPIAVNGGMANKPFKGGKIYIHDLPLVTSGIVLNSIGAAGWSLGDTTIKDCGSFLTGTWWTVNGSPVATLGPNGVAIDGDLLSGVISSRGSMGYMRCKNIFLGPAPYALYDDQTSFIILGGTGANTTGCYIKFIDADGVGQPLDCQQSNVDISGIHHKNCTLGPKLGHGASHCTIGPICVENSGQWGINIYGGNATSGDAAFNTIGPVTGSGASEKVQLTGTAVSATNTTVTLPAAALQIDNYYRANEAVIVITGGTGAGQEASITGYVGATRVATIFGSGAGGNWSTNPDATSTFNIYYAGNRETVLFSQDTSVARVHDNKITVGPVTNLGGRKWDVYSNLSQTASVNNTVVMEADAGGTSQTANVLNYPSARVVPGAALAAVTKVGLAGTQTITDSGSGISPTLVLNTPVEDTFQRSGVTNPQCDATNNGIRVLTAGLKHWKASTKFGSSGNAPAAGATLRLFINRGGTPIIAKTMVIGTLNDEQMITAEGDLYHEEGWFGGTANLYTASLFYFASGSTDTITVLQNLSTFLSVSD